MKKALITGITGQDGSYLSEFLIEKGYDVHGIIRRSSADYKERIAGTSKWTLAKKIKLFIDSFVAFSFMPIRLVSIIGGIILILLAVWCVLEHYVSL